MAGLTDQGLTIKRQREVLTDLRDEAQVIFQDLVPPGDVVDTSDSSTLGRLTGLLSVPTADLWEAVQEVYLAFDPNSATGIALDNLVMYAGLTRNPPSVTTAMLLVWGNDGVFLPAFDSQVRSTDNNLYEIAVAVQFTKEQNNGFRFTVGSVTPGTVYSLTMTAENTTSTVSYTAVAGDTMNMVLGQLSSQLSTSTYIDVSSVNGEVTVTTKDPYDFLSVVENNVTITKIRTRTEARNLEVGSIEQRANTITNIATPVLGWDSVTNPEDALIGRNEETDEELRIRFRDSKFLRAQNISDALYSGLLELDGVVSVSIYENEGSAYDPTYDLPGHSFKAVVLGGNLQEIGTVIWRNKPLGIASEGNTVVTIFDSQQFQREVRFDRPSSVRVYIDLTLTLRETTFPADGEQKIKEALIDYFRENFGIGNTVIYSRLFTPINTIPGHQVDSLLIGTNPSFLSASNILINYDEIASLSTEDIVITIS